MAWLKIYARRSSLRVCQPFCSYDYFMQRQLGDSPVNYYSVLGLKSNATPSQIKSAYYRLSKLYHPDTAKAVPFAKEKFAQLSTAYDVLRNPHERALYDRKHTPAASFSDDDIEYRDFLQRRGTFPPRSTAFETSARSSSFQYEKFYKQNYEKVLRYNWEAKKNADYRPERMKQTGPPDSGRGSSVVSILVAVVGFAYVILYEQ